MSKKWLLWLICASFLLGVSVYATMWVNDAIKRRDRANQIVEKTEQINPVPSGSSAIALSKQLAEERARLQEEAGQFGLFIEMRDDLEGYTRIRERLLKNEKLGQAFKTTTKEGVCILFSTEFKIAPKCVFVNINASDEEIITFLLG